MSPMEQLQPPTNEDELFRLLPEIQVLPDGQNIREEVERIFLEDAPDYFWTVRGSENHHPFEHRSTHGLYIHTKRTFTAYTSMAGTYEASGIIDVPNYVFGTVASLIHDLFKYGRPEDFENKGKGSEFVPIPGNFHEYADGLAWLPEYSTRDHDLTAGEYVREETSLPNDVVSLVETHQGHGFGDGPSPDGYEEEIHHLADLAASRSKCDWYLMDPPEEVLEQYPHLSDSTYTLEGWHE